MPLFSSSFTLHTKVLSSSSSFPPSLVAQNGQDLHRKEERLLHCRRCSTPSIIPEALSSGKAIHAGSQHLQQQQPQQQEEPSRDQEGGYTGGATIQAEPELPQGEAHCQRSQGSSARQDQSAVQINASC